MKRLLALPVLSLLLVACQDAGEITEPVLGLESGALHSFETATVADNGGFETGDFTGWNQTGNDAGALASYSVVGGLGSVLPTEGAFMAFVQGSTGTDLNFLWTDPFNWSAYTEVCFDIRVLFNGPAATTASKMFDAIAREPRAPQPQLVSMDLDGGGVTYGITNHIGASETSQKPVVAGGDTGFEGMTAWETLCFDPSQIPFDRGDPNNPLSLQVLFGWSGTSFADQAFLVDNVVGTVSSDDPTNKDQCKKGGWQVFGFRNQGQCIRFVNTGKDSRT